MGCHDHHHFVISHIGRPCRNTRHLGRGRVGSLSGNPRGDDDTLRGREHELGSDHLGKEMKDKERSIRVLCFLDF